MTIKEKQLDPNPIAGSISRKLAAFVGCFYCVVCIVFAAFPDFFLSVLDWRSAAGLYAAATMDLAVGLILLWAAPYSRSRVGFSFIGGVNLLGALIYVLIPVGFWIEYFNWWMIEQLTLARVAAILVGLPIGVFIIYATIATTELPRGSEATDDA